MEVKAGENETTNPSIWYVHVSTLPRGGVLCGFGGPVWMGMVVEVRMEVRMVRIGVASIKDDAASGSGHVQPSRHASIGRVTVCAAKSNFK